MKESSRLKRPFREGTISLSNDGRIVFILLQEEVIELEERLAARRYAPQIEYAVTFKSLIDYVIESNGSTNMSMTAEERACDLEDIQPLITVLEKAVKRLRAACKP